MFRILFSVLVLIVTCVQLNSCSDVDTINSGMVKPGWITPGLKISNLEYRIFRSVAAGTDVSYHIYVPEQYYTDVKKRFAVLYWLHGTGGGLEGIPQLVKYFASAMAAGKMSSILVVFPNGMETSMWCDSMDGSVPMEMVVVKELIPQIDADFRTVASRQGRLIEGFSMGGYGAGRLGFRYHSLFGGVSMLAGGPLDPDFKIAPNKDPSVKERLLSTVYGGDIDYFRAQSPWFLAEENATAIRSGTILRVVIGERDETLEFNRRFHLRLSELGITHDFTVLPGVAHNPMMLLNALGDSSWQFYRRAFGEAR